MVPLENSAQLALSFLFHRLKWPVPMTRWRAAKEIRNLLDDARMRPAATKMLLDYLEECKTESEVCEILTVVFLTSSEGRPTRGAIIPRIHCPSLLASMILERTYGSGMGLGEWRTAHSGEAPRNFESGSYFERYKTEHAPLILRNNLAQLENQSGHPFQRQWAYEWKCLRDRLGTNFTQYPHYFDDVLEARAGIVGQYWQRMREVFLSAYHRTIAYAVDHWALPQEIAESYCIEITYGVAGYFEVEPGTRPDWLADIPERFCTPGVAFCPLILELANNAKEGGMLLVSLDVPVALSVEKYARLTVSTHLVTHNYQPPPGGYINEREQLLLINETFELAGLPTAINLDEAKAEGLEGDEVPVCNRLIPIPYSSWQQDYLRLGIPMPTSYIVAGANIACTRAGIHLRSIDGAVISSTRLWNDDWTPPQPKGGSTRCGIATMIKEDILSKAQMRMGRKLAFCAQLRVWTQDREYGKYTMSANSGIVIE